MELFGFEIGLAEIIGGAVGLVWIILRLVAPKTETKWDDKIVDMVEGLAASVGVDPDDLAKQSTGKLKERIVTHVKTKIGGATTALVLCVLLAPAMLSLTACASMEAESPAQRVFAVQADYNAVLAVAVAYESMPRCTVAERPACSEVDVVDLIRKADRDAWAAIKAAQDTVRAEGATDSMITLALAAARNAVAALQTILINHGVM